VKDPALRLEQERTNQVLASEFFALLRAPLVQAFMVWALAEYMMTSSGPWSGPAARAGASALEVGSMLRIFDVEKVAGDVSKMSQAIAPMVGALAAK
jgi:hypothetical protein